MDGMGWPTLQCPIEHLGNRLVTMGAGAAMALFVLKSFNAVVMVATAPPANGGGADAQSLGNSQVRLSLSAGQKDVPTLHHAVRQRGGLEGDHRLTWAYSLNRHPSTLLLGNL